MPEPTAGIAHAACRMPRHVVFHGERRCPGPPPPLLPAPLLAPSRSHRPNTLPRSSPSCEEKHGPLRTPRQLARFLCGLTSPATSRTWFTPPHSSRRARLTSHSAFALLEDHPFADILTYCESLLIP